MKYAYSFFFLNQEKNIRNNYALYFKTHNNKNQTDDSQMN